MDFSHEQEERYARNISMKELGEQGQAKLLNSRVLLIGAGGLGSPTALYLAAAGIGTIGIVDFDSVSLSNLQRQILYKTKDLDKSKVLSAQKTLRALNPDVRVIPYQEKLKDDNIIDIITDLDYDFIVDASDNFSTKFLINDACVGIKKPFVHAAVLGFMGQIMTYVPNQGRPCYRCVFDTPPPENTDISTGRSAGVLGAVAGIVGALEATETIKYLTGIGELLLNQLLIIDAKTMNFRKVKLQKNSRCLACSSD